MAPEGVRLAARAIRSGDAAALLPSEAASITARAPGRRDASGAARLAARAALGEWAAADAAIPRGPSGQPLWPAGLVGSLGHDDEMAVAAVARRTPAIRSLGIDVEPAHPLPSDMRDLVVTSQDRAEAIEAGLATRVLFSAKEAVYKAAFPLDGRFLDYGDITIDLTGGRARTRTGHSLRLRFILAPRIVTLAIVAD